MQSSDKIVITGAAGLVGQNLVTLLEEKGYTNIVALDKHPYNLQMLRGLHPQVQAVQADLANTGDWEGLIKGAAIVLQLHAQITGKTAEPFIRNNIDAT